MFVYMGIKIVSLLIFFITKNIHKIIMMIMRFLKMMTTMTMMMIRVMMMRVIMMRVMMKM